MIIYNNTEISVKHFPDNTQMLFDVNVNSEDRVDNIEWNYENDEECMTLYYLVKHIRTVLGNNREIELTMFYCPNARMDRVKSCTEVFTLKYFAEFINSLNFKKVYVMDAHSNVLLALIDRVEERRINTIIQLAIERMKQDTVCDNLIIYFPDDGSMKRYKDIFSMGKYTLLYGSKVRDWKTGKITGLSIFSETGGAPEELAGRPVLMIDDIISYGGTLAYSADKLKELGAGVICAYASHTENNILDPERGTLLKRLETGVVKKIYTTSSLFNKKSEYITQII